MNKTLKIEKQESQHIGFLQGLREAIELVGGREWEFKKDKHPNAKADWLNGVEYGFILALERLDSVVDELRGFTK